MDIPIIAPRRIGLMQLLVLLTLLGFVGVAVPGWLDWIAQSQAAIAFPYGLDYGEGPVLDQALGLARGEQIYRIPGGEPPFTLANYPPLYPLLQLPFVWLVGPALWYGRVINLVCILLAAAAIGGTIWRTTRSVAGALVGALLLPLFPYIVHWSAFVRVDSLALAFSCAGLWAAAGVQLIAADDAAGRRRARRWLVVAIVFCSAAVFSRQSAALAAPLAVGVWLLRQRWQWALGFALAMIVVCGGAALLLNLATGGAFYYNTVVANVNPFSWGSVRNYASEIWEHMAGFVVAAAAFVLVGWWRGRPIWWLAAPFLVGAIGSAITIGKTGSNVNYLFELCAALSLACGALVATIPPLWGRALLVAALAAQIGPLRARTTNEYLPRVAGRIADRVAVSELAALVATANGPVLADEWMALVPVGGKRLMFQPFELKQLADADLWDDTALARRLMRAEYPLILLYDSPDWDSQGERWTPLLRYAISEGYAEVDRIAETRVMRPR